MAFTQINQRTLLPIINEYVIIPDEPINKRISISDAITAVPGSSFAIFINQKHFVLPTFERSGGYPEDWYAELRTASST